MLLQGEEWQKFRQLVQQDMMKPKSALYYIKDIEDISMELVARLGECRDIEGVTTVGPLLQQYALEAIGCVFLGSRLGALQGSEVGWTTEQ